MVGGGVACQNHAPERQGDRSRYRRPHSGSAVDRCPRAAATGAAGTPTRAGERPHSRARNPRRLRGRRPSRGAWEAVVPRRQVAEGKQCRQRGGGEAGGDAQGAGEDRLGRRRRMRPAGDAPRISPGGHDLTEGGRGSSRRPRRPPARGAATATRGTKEQLEQELHVGRRRLRAASRVRRRFFQTPPGGQAGPRL